MNLIQTITILSSDFHTPFNIGDIIQTYYDSGSILVYVNGVQKISGSDIGGESLNHVLQYRRILTGYQFCSASTLIRWKGTTTYPYVTSDNIFNSPSCPSSGAGDDYTCDVVLGIIGTTNPSTDTSSDGAIHILASGTGSLKFALEDLDYSIMSNTSGSFTSLGVGDYTVYVKNQYGCVDKRKITLKAAFDYGVIYRMEYKNLAGTQARIDILKRGWTGSITTLDKADGSPIILYMRGENSDKFIPVFPTEAEVNMMSINDLQFSSFFTDYEHQYICIFYKDLGSGLTEIWRGANMPGLYTEPFTIKPYPVTIQFTDQLALLESYDFLDDNLNNFTGIQKVIQVIALVLKKTELNLPIRCGINVFDIGMSTGATDDPLNQCNIDLDCFYNEDYTNPKDFNFVLTELLKPFGARLVQSYGYWWILENDSLTDTFNYREFDKDGTYVSHGTYSPIVNSDQVSSTSRIVWKEQSQNMEVIRSFGKLTITQTTDPKTSVLPNFGFEKPLVVDSQVPDWTLSLNGQDSVNMNVIKRDDTQEQQIVVNINPNLTVSSLKDLTIKIATAQAIFVYYTGTKTQSYPDPNTDYENAFLINKGLKNVTIDPQDDFEFSIDYYVDLQKGLGNSAPAYLFFRALIQLGNWFFVENSNNGNDGNLGSVLRSVADLEAITTTSLTVGATTTFIDVTNNVSKTYRLFAGTAAQNDPLVIRPTDYNSSTNAKIWRLLQYGNWATSDYGNGWNEIVAKDPQQGWNTKKISGPMPPVAGTGDLNVTIMPMWYAPTTTILLADVPTTDKNPGFIYITSNDFTVLGTTIITKDVYYQLVIPEIGTDVSNLAGLYVPLNGAVKPNDYNIYTNNVVWRLVSTVAKKSFDSDYGEQRTFFFANGSISEFDNVIVKFKPKAQSPTGVLPIGNFTTDPPKEQNFILTTTSSIKNNLTYDCFLGDASLLINNSKFIYRNFFTLNSGEPTTKWTRLNVPEANTLIGILCLRFLQQYANPTWKLSGNFETRYQSGGIYHEQAVSFISTIVQNSRFLLPYYMEIDDKNCDVKVETQEVISKTSTATAPFNGAFSQQNFGNSFNE